MIINPVERTKHLLQLDVVLEASEIRDLFKKELNKTAKSAKIKGFRPGKTPVNLVKNLYGTQLMVDLVNKNLVNQAYEYLEKQGIKTFSNFVFDNENLQYKFDTDDIQDFNASLLFVKEPDLDADELDYAGNLQYFLPELDQDKIEEQLRSIRYDVGGMQESSEPVNEDSLVTFDAIEQENGADKDGGHAMTFSYAVRSVKEEPLRDQLTGKKVGETLTININDLTDNGSMLARQVLKLENEEGAENIGPEFKVTISRIENKVLAEINDDFFSKLDPNGSIKSEDDIVRILKDNHYNAHRGNSDALFFDGFKDFVMEKFDLDLDDDYYKKFFTQVARLNQHALEYHLDEYKEDYKWSWIKGFIDQEYGINVGDAEIQRALMAEISGYFGGVSLPEHMYKRFLDDAYKNPKMIERKKDQIYMAKLAELMIRQMNVPETMISLDEYNGKIEALNDKLVKKAETEHNHDHGHDHHHPAHEEEAAEVSADEDQEKN